jgi:hypothetical protein
MLSHLLYKEKYFDQRNELTEDGFFYNTIEDIEDQIGFARKKQMIALEILEEEGLIKSEVRGMPARKYFCMNHEKILDLMGTDCTNQTNKFVPKEQTSLCQRSGNYIINTNKVENSAPHCTDVPSGKKILIKRTKPIPVVPPDPPTNKEPLFHRKRVKKVFVSEEVKEIIEFWGKNGFKIHRENTFSYVQVVKHINELMLGILFNRLRDSSWHNRRFSMAEIKQGISNFALAAFNPDYLPISSKTKEKLQNFPLKDFFYTVWSKNEYKSEFLRHLGKPVMVSDSQKLFVLKDDQPYVTSFLLKWYKQTFGNRDNGNFSFKNKNDLITTGRRLREFLKQYSESLKITPEAMRIYDQSDPLMFLAVQLTRMMDKMIRENEGLFPMVTTGWLHSEKTIPERLSTFLRSERMMK